MYQLSYFYTNNKNIFGRFYPHNKSYLGKSLSKQGAILLFWTKSYPKDNLNHDKNNKIQLLHIVLWTDGNNIYPYHLAIRPTCLQIVYPHEKFIIRLPSNISAPSDTPSGGGPQFILIPYWNFLVYFTRRIWLVNCETLSKTNTETCNFSASCVDTREIMLAIISVFLPSPATAAWILDSADPILGGVEMNKSAEHTTPEPRLGHRYIISWDG